MAYSVPPSSQMSFPAPLWGGNRRWSPGEDLLKDLALPSTEEGRRNHLQELAISKMLGAVPQNQEPPPAVWAGGGSWSVTSLVYSRTLPVPNRLESQLE